KPEWNAQAEHELGDFHGGVAKMPALIERPQAEREVYRSCGVKRGIDDWNSPPPDVPGQPPIHYGIGNITKRVIEEMRKDVGEHHQAAGKANLTYASAAQQRDNARPRVKGACAYVKNGRCFYRHDQASLQAGRRAPPSFPKSTRIHRILRSIQSLFYSPHPGFGGHFGGNRSAGPNNANPGSSARFVDSSRPRRLFQEAIKFGSKRDALRASSR